MRGAGQGAVTQAGDDGEGDVGETADSKAAEENGLEVNRDRNGVVGYFDSGGHFWPVQFSKHFGWKGRLYNIGSVLTRAMKRDVREFSRTRSLNGRSQTTSPSIS